MTQACGCSFPDDSEGRPFAYREKVVTARKKRRCCECGEGIAAGEKYRYISGRWEWGWKAYHMCLTCFRIARDLCPRGHPLGGLRERVYECYGTDYLGEWEDEDEKWLRFVLSQGIVREEGQTKEGGKGVANGTRTR